MGAIEPFEESGLCLEGFGRAPGQDRAAVEVAGGEGVEGLFGFGARTDVRQSQLHGEEDNAKQFTVRSSQVIVHGSPRRFVSRDSSRAGLLNRVLFIYGRKISVSMELHIDSLIESRVRSATFVL